MRPVGSAAELERRRHRAITLLKQGEKPSVVVRILGISWTTLCRWRSASTADSGLSSKPHKSHLRLSAEQLATLVTELKKGATAHGWPNALWTGERVATLIRRLFHICYTSDHVRVLLRKKLGWTSQKPEELGRERDEEAIKHWRTVKFPRIKKTPKSGEHTSFSSMNRALC